MIRRIRWATLSSALLGTVGVVLYIAGAISFEDAVVGMLLVVIIAILSLREE